MIGEIPTPKFGEFESKYDEVLQKYHILNKVGEGTFAKVFKAKCLKTSKIVAIKHIDNFAKNDYGLVKTIREIQIMRQLGEQGQSGTFIPDLIDVIIPESEKQGNSLKNIFVVMEYENTDLRTAINRGILSDISQDQIKLIVYNLLCAV